MILESTFQKKLINKYEKEGYYVIKLMKTNKNGIPDLIAIKPVDGLCEVLFIEVKREGNTTSPIQKYRIKELNDFGIKAIVLQSGK